MIFPALRPWALCWSARPRPGAVSPSPVIPDLIRRRMSAMANVDLRFVLLGVLFSQEWRTDTNRLCIELRPLRGNSPMPPASRAVTHFGPPNTGRLIAACRGSYLSLLFVYEHRLSLRGVGSTSRRLARERPDGSRQKLHIPPQSPFEGGPPRYSKSAHQTSPRAGWALQAIPKNTYHQNTALWTSSVCSPRCSVTALLHRPTPCLWARSVIL